MKFVCKVCGYIYEGDAAPAECPVCHAKSDMFEEVKEIMIDTLNCDADKVTMEANIFDDLGADSLDAVELNLALEEKLGISIDEEAMANMKTVADIVNYIESNK